MNKNFNTSLTKGGNEAGGNVLDFELFGGSEKEEQKYRGSETDSAVVSEQKIMSLEKRMEDRRARWERANFTKDKKARVGKIAILAQAA